ncbi:hypothetical protein TU52_08070 [Bacillus cereus]|nr:hypothetical protein TU52_08070 [Bacillus cereus]
MPTKFEIISDFHEPIIEQYKEFLKENEITVAGIEFIRSLDGTIYTYDINTNTNYNSDAESVANQFGMLELATFLGRELEKQVESVK